MTNNNPSALFTGDNLDILSGLDSDSVDLIYLDPPFNSKRMYSAPVGSKAAGSSFKDMWTWDDVDENRLEYLFDNYPHLAGYIQSIQESHGKPMMAFITYMTQRIIELYRVLSPTGSFYLHVDPTASHYLKVVLDSVFGVKNFRNEIIWEYGLGGSSKRMFSKKHDIVLFYTKTEAYYFDKPLVQATSAMMAGKMKGMKDVWSDIPSLNNMAKERTGYPTQKPLTLLERIITASSQEGDIVLDPFCGCATTCVAAESLGRKWIGIDIEPQAADLVIDRLEDMGLFHHANYIHLTDVPHRTDLTYEEPTGKDVKRHLFKKQGGCCKGCETQFEEQHFEVDHIIPRSKGGGDYIENFQLLCGHCNRVKGARPMEYLMAKLRARRDAKAKLTFGS